MNRKFITNLALLIFLNLLVKPFWIFGIDRSVQNRVGSTEYGIFFSLFSLTVLLNILLDLGLTNFNNRAISRNSRLFSGHFANIAMAKFILAIFFFLLCLIVAVTIDYDRRQIILLMVIGFNQFIASFIVFMRSNISGMQHYTTDSILSVIDRLLIITFSAILLWSSLLPYKMSIEWFAGLQTLSYLITAVIVYFVLLHKVKKIQWNFNLRFLTRIFKISLPYAVLVFLMSFYNRIDSVMLERILPNGKEQAGIYAQAFRILDAVTMIGVLFAGLLLPMYSRMLKAKEDVSSLLHLAFSLIVVPAILLAIISYFYASPIMTRLYSGEESASILSVLMISHIAICCSFIFGALLTANGSLKYLNWMALGGLIINLLLNILFIPRYGAYGSAIASLITGIYTATIQIILCVLVVKLKLSFTLFFRLFLFTCIMIIIGYFMKDIKLPLLYSIGIIGTTGLFVSLIIGIYDWQKMQVFFKSFKTVK